MNNKKAERLYHELRAGSWFKATRKYVYYIVTHQLDFGTEYQLRRYNRAVNRLEHEILYQVIECY